MGHLAHVEEMINAWRVLVGKYDGESHTED